MTLEEIEVKWLRIKDEVNPGIIGDDEIEEVGFLISEVKRLKGDIKQFLDSVANFHPDNSNYYEAKAILKKALEEVKR